MLIDDRSMLDIYLNSTINSVICRELKTQGAKKNDHIHITTRWKRKIMKKMSKKRTTEVERTAYCWRRRHKKISKLLP